MSADTFILDGRAYSWRRIREMRREQLEARKSARPAQGALFELKNDSHPAAERTAGGRYTEPTFLDRMRN